MTHKSFAGEDRDILIRGYLREAWERLGDTESYHLVDAHGYSHWSTARLGEAISKAQRALDLIEEGRDA